MWIRINFALLQPLQNWALLTSLPFAGLVPASNQRGKQLRQFRWARTMPSSSFVDQHMIAYHIAVALAVTLASAGPASAASCGNNAAGFDGWLASFKKQAVAAGISPKTVSSALSEVGYDTRVIHLDRSQKPFKQSFEVFVRNRVTPGRVSRGASLLKSNAANRLTYRAERSHPESRDALLIMMLPMQEQLQRDDLFRSLRNSVGFSFFAS